MFDFGAGRVSPAAYKRILTRKATHGILEALFAIPIGSFRDEMGSTIDVVAMAAAEGCPKGMMALMWKVMSLIIRRGHTTHILNM